MFDTEKMHHAYCIEGKKEAVLPELLNMLEKKLKFATTGNPDFHLEEFQSLGIDESRVIKAMSQYMSFSGTKKIFVIAASFINKEAQNSLLKIFEEPTEGCHFFLILPTSQILLPTLRSRMEVVRMMKGEAEDGRRYAAGSAEEFVRADIPERLRMAGRVAEIEDKRAVIDFIADMEACLRGRMDSKSSDVSKKAEAIAEVLKMKRYLFDRGASAKMILEYLALVV